MNRAEAKKFADAWIVSAAALLDAGRWHAAYYLAGYAVECGLKACILSYIDSSGIIFQDKKFAEKCFTHDIEALVKAANLEVLAASISRRIRPWVSTGKPSKTGMSMSAIETRVRPRPENCTAPSWTIRTEF